MDTLVIVPCGAQKIWQRNFLAGETPAKDAYTSTLFSLHRRYAEAFGTEWRILSAWYGLTHPEQMITDYDAKFSDSDLDPRKGWRLQGIFRQARALGGRYGRVILLGSAIYRQIARTVLQGIFLPHEIEEPFAGLDLFATQHAICERLKNVVDKPKQREYEEKWAERR